MSPATWADLGCGNGLFTNALASILQPASTIYAVDIDPAVHSLSLGANHVKLITLQQDFSTAPLSIESCDGLLLANSLHFVKDKQACLSQLKKILKPAGRMIVIEYDMDEGNRWIPYPVSYNEFAGLAGVCGFQSCQKLEHTSSSYQRAGIYSALIMR